MIIVFIVFIICALGIMKVGRDNDAPTGFTVFCGGICLVCLAVIIYLVSAG